MALNGLKRLSLEKNRKQDFEKHILPDFLIFTPIFLSIGFFPSVFLTQNIELIKNFVC